MFSVVIPLYNKKVSIVPTLKSVLDQSFKEFEVLVVNDGSTDNSEKAVLHVVDARIRLINKENKGVSSARNRGISEAAYDYIAFLDADDIWDQDYLLEQKKLIDNYPGASMWGLGWTVIHSDKKADKTQTNILQSSRGVVKNYFKRNSHNNLFWTSAVVVSKQTFDLLETFDENIDIGEDLDMWFRIILEREVVFCNQVFAYYNQDDENRAMARKKPDLKRTIQYYVEKYDGYKTLMPEAISYIHAFCAGNLIPYYFGSKGERKLAKDISAKFDYSKIHRKYTLFYRTPYLIGLVFYMFYLLKKQNRFHN